MKIRMLVIVTAIIAALGSTSCSSVSFSNSQSTASLANTPTWDDNPTTTWTQLQHMSSAKLAEAQSKTSDPTQTAWLQLARILKQKNISTQQITNDLMAWRAQHPSHPANQLFPDDASLSRLAALPPPQHIAILLPESGEYSAAANAVREGFLHAYYANLPKVGKQGVKFYNTAQTQNIAAVYQQALADGADFIVGPLTKDNVKELIKNGPVTTPILALNYTDPQNGTLPNNFYEFGLLPEDEVLQMADRARAAGQVRAIVIAPQSAWGHRLVTAFSARWQTLGGSIQESWTYSAKTDLNLGIAQLLNVNPSADKKLMHDTNDKNVLQHQRRQDFDVIFLFSQSHEAHTIVPLLRYYYATDIPIYTTSSTYAGKPNPEKDVDLNGVIVCDIPWNKSPTEQTAGSNSPDRLYAVGQDAYLLSQSLPRLTQLPHFPIYASTGALALTEHQQIHRRIPCVAFRNGLL